ncbi:MAG: DnaA N-terminal domain-containing protein [Pseudomonadota bacterium]
MSSPEAQAGVAPRTTGKAMQARRITGAGAGALKYDVLTALGTFALAADRSTQRRVLRLITLITARYNWQANDLSCGRREIARLWSVDERTVKREIGALKALGFLVVKRPGARGRVTSYMLDIDAVLATSRMDWERVGPDFAERMTALSAPQAEPETVVPFPTTERSEWSRARAILKQADAARYEAWFKPLVREGIDGAALILRAPSTFHADYVTTHLIGELIRSVAGVERRLTSVRLVVA